MENVVLPVSAELPEMSQVESVAVTMIASASAVDLDVHAARARGAIASRASAEVVRRTSGTFRVTVIGKR